ncbi:MAG TPA: hypothetical protein VJ888_01470 [Mobilitalea sp.]|nr:hypothetical protein [Mobilitalea sp.]
MKKVLGLVLILVALCFIPASIGEAAKATTKSYTITTKSVPSKSFTKMSTYNKYTKHYYVFRDILEDCEKNGGGNITVKKGTYTITNVLCIPSNVTLTLEDGVTIKKGTQTGTDKFGISKSIFQLIKPSKLKSSKYYSKYNGEKNIKIIGKGDATIDLQSLQSSIGIILGHNQNVSISGITFKNLNMGHFIEMDASKDVTVKDCSFLESIESPKHNKEAINIDTPDPLTGGFNCAWSAQDKTPNLNVTIDNCTFKNIDCAVGTHRYSQEQDEDGKYTINVYHTNIKITHSRFYGIRSYVFDIINWKDVEISDCEISGGSYLKETKRTLSSGELYEDSRILYNTVLRLKGIDNFTFKNNTCSDVGSISATTYITATSSDYNALYTDLEFKLTVDNVKDLIFNNTYTDVINNWIDTCPLKPGSIIEDASYSKYIKYGAPNTPSDYIAIYVGLNYWTLAEARAAEKNQ